MIYSIINLPNRNVATCSTDNLVKIWSTPSWNLILSYSQHTSALYALELIDNTTIVSSGADSFIKIWSFLNGAILKTITILIQFGGNNYYSSYWSLRLLLNGFLACGTYVGNGYNNPINLYNVSSGILFKTLSGHTNGICYLEILNSQYLASGGYDFKVIIWDLSAYTLKFNLAGHTNYVYSLKLLSNNLLASTGFDRTIRIWNWNTGSLIKTINAHSNRIWYALNLLDANILVSGSDDNKLNFWNINDDFQLCQSLNTGIQITTLLLVGTNCKYRIEYIIF